MKKFLLIWTILLNLTIANAQTTGKTLVPMFLFQDSLSGLTIDYGFGDSLNGKKSGKWYLITTGFSTITTAYFDKDKKNQIWTTFEVKMKFYDKEGKFIISKDEIKLEKWKEKAIITGMYRYKDGVLTSSFNRYISKKGSYEDRYSTLSPQGYFKERCVLTFNKNGELLHSTYLDPDGNWSYNFYYKNGKIINTPLLD